VPAVIKSLDFIVIGASKSGTTALFRYLRADPDLYLPPEKDAPFFAVDKYWKNGWERYAAELFAHAPRDALWGTVTPRYMEDPRVPERIAATMPEIRLIALLRNPIDRAFSQYRQQVRRGKETRSFAECVDLLLEGPDRQHSEDRILSPGHYGRALERFLEHFETDQLLVLFSEDLSSNPGKVIDRVRVFLSLPPDFTPSNLGKRYHVGGSRERFPDLIRILKRLGLLRRLWRRLPRERRGALRTWFFTQVNVIEEPPREIPSALRRRLADHYREDVRNLSHQIGRAVPWNGFRTSDDDDG
jgi:hypothetical protein